jgi:hypothetical protein
VSLARTLVASLAAATLVGCSPVAEQLILNQFFNASRLRDRTALQDFATVSFEPSTQGIVTDYEISSVTREKESGGIVSKDVSISASVKLPGGQMTQKNFVITMRRPRPGRSPDVTGRWIITSIKDAAGAPSTPRS